MLLRKFSCTSVGPFVVIKQTLKPYLNIILDQLHSYMVSAFPTRDKVYEQDKFQCLRARIVLWWYQERNTECQLKSCLPNSTDLFPIEQLLMFWNGTSELMNNAVISLICLTATWTSGTVWLWPSAKDYGIYDNDGCSSFASKMWYNALLGRWSWCFGFLV